MTDRWKTRIGGAFIGFVVGLLGPIVLVAGCVRDDRMEWSILFDPEMIAYFSVVPLLGTINGSVGAWDGRRLGVSRQWPVVLVPLLLLIYPIVMYQLFSNNSKTWGESVLIVAIVGPFVWVAGRMAQQYGVRRYRRNAPTGNFNPQPNVG